MRIRRQDNGETPIINISSLLDVMFILLIFFLATSTLQREEHDIKVNLPERSEERSLSASTKTLVINVRRAGDYYLQNRVRSLDEVRQVLSDAIQQNPSQKVLIRGDREALHGYVAAVVGTCKSVGIQEANIGYQYKTIQ
ncbi:MAG: ExbD/TolR family protein [Planctomycetota bacterium]|jgi:biopolymer transport protein ExbD